MKKSLILSLCIFLQLGLLAQEENQFLQTIGKTDKIYSQILGETREIYVQLPDSYEPGSNDKYPVAYVLDGGVFLPTLATVHSFYSGGFMPEMVLIGIATSQNRDRDLTTSEVKMRYGRPAPENGKADRFLKFIAQEVIPYVEKNFPVTDYRTLIGHSFGGLFTINAMLKQPQLFANYLAIDPSLDWDDQKLIKEAEGIFANNSFKGKSLFISLSGQLHNQNPEVTIDNVMEDESGATIFSRSNIMFSDLVRQHKQNGLAFDWRFYPNDLHGTVPLPSLIDGLLATFTWFQMEETEKFNDFETPIADLEKLINYRADKLKGHFGYQVAPYPADLMNAMGYMSMDMGKDKKAKMFLDTYIKYYPESANAYDTMADYYERQKQPAEALKYVTKAFEISGSDYHKEKMEKLKGKK